MRNKPIDLKYKSPDWFLYHRILAMKLKKILLYTLYHDFHYVCIFQISIEKGKNTPNYHGDVFLGGKKHHCIVFFLLFFFYLIASLSTKIQCIIN